MIKTFKLSLLIIISLLLLLLINTTSSTANNTIKLSSRTMVVTGGFFADKTTLVPGKDASRDIGFAELSKKRRFPCSFDALGNLPIKTIITVRYKRKSLRVPKIDVGCGIKKKLPGATGTGTSIDLSVPAIKKLGIPRNKPYNVTVTIPN